MGVIATALCAAAIVAPRDALASARGSVAVSAACIARLSALAFSRRIARCAFVGFDAILVPSSLSRAPRWGPLIYAP